MRNAATWPATHHKIGELISPLRSRRGNLTVRRGDLTSVHRARLTASLAKAELISRITALGNDSEIEGMGLCSGGGIYPAKSRAVAIKEREVCALMGRSELADRVIIVIGVTGFSCSGVVWPPYSGGSAYCIEI
jgi:hypothetical protein